MAHRTVIALLVLLMAIEPAVSAGFFSFFQPRHHYAAHRQRGRQAEPEQIPDCRQIREAVRTLTPANLERALKSATKKQREIIDKCALGGD